MRTLDCSDSTPLSDKTTDTDTTATDPDATDTGDTIGVLLALIIGTDCNSSSTISTND